MLNAKKATALLRKSKKNTININELSHEILSGINDVINSSKTISCQSGCSHCCYLRVSAYDYELISIYQFIVEKMKNSDKELILKSLEEQHNIVKNLTLEEHHHTNVKCPFLIENKCSVYPVRPVSCAGYHSLERDLCIKSNNNPHDESFGIPKDRNIEIMKNETHAFVQTFIENSGEELKELISGMHYLINDPKVIMQWQNKK